MNSKNWMLRHAAAAHTHGEVTVALAGVGRSHITIVFVALHRSSLESGFPGEGGSLGGGRLFCTSQGHFGLFLRRRSLFDGTIYSIKLRTVVSSLRRNVPFIGIALQELHNLSFRFVMH